MLTGAKISVGAPFFNLTFVPMFMPVVIVAAIGPFLSWKRADIRGIGEPALLGLAIFSVASVAVSGLVLGVYEPIGLAVLALALWLFSATVADLVARAHFRKVGLITGLRRLIGLPRTAYGLFFGHAGLAVAVAGVALISGWAVESIQVQRPGDSVAVGSYEFTLSSVRDEEGPNYRAEVAAIKVSRNGEPVGLLRPERRWYPVEGKSTTEAAIDTRWHGDLYAVVGEPDGKGGWVTRYYYNPGVVWMWIGSLFMAFGGLVSLTDRRLRVGAPSRPSRKTPLPAAASLVLALVTGAFLALSLPSSTAIAAGISADEMLKDEALEQRARDVGKDLRCMVCQNQSIFDSNATLAKDLRILVRERVQAGDSDDEIKDYVVSRYGDYVLLKPPVKPITYLLVDHAGDLCYCRLSRSVTASCAIRNAGQ